MENYRKRMGSEEFKTIIRGCISECRGSGYDLFDRFGEPCNPVTILLSKLKVPALFIGLWANVKATHTPMKDKLEEFLTAPQLSIIQEIEDVYMNSTGSTAQMKKEMRKIVGAN
jgi:hypothetical protein